MKQKNFNFLFFGSLLLTISIGLWGTIACVDTTLTSDNPPTGSDLGYVRFNINRGSLAQEEYPTDWRVGNTCASISLGASGGRIVTAIDKDLAGAVATEKNKKVLQIKVMVVSTGEEKTYYYGDSDIKNDNYIDVAALKSTKSKISIRFLDKCCSIDKRLEWLSTPTDNAMIILSGDAKDATNITNQDIRLTYLYLNGTFQCF